MYIERLKFWPKKVNMLKKEVNNFGSNIKFG